jgi:hypothetical protein
MGWFQEERAEAFLLALGVQGCPGRARMPALLDLLADLLVIEHGCRIRRARYAELPDGRGLIMLPRGLTERQIDEQAFHELSHYLHGHGAAIYFRQWGDMSNPRERALAESWEAMEEREVEDFLLAFLLPSRLVYLMRDDAELAEQSDCSPELVRLRRERLRGKVYELRRPAAWSAYPHFLLTRWNAPHRPALRIRSRNEAGPLYEVPTSPEDADHLQWRLNAELVAFTYDEFATRYRAYRVDPETDAMIPLAELAGWAQRLGRGAAGPAPRRLL